MILPPYIYNIVKFSKFPQDKCKHGALKIVILKKNKLFYTLMKIQDRFSNIGIGKVEIIEFDKVTPQLLSSSCAILYISKDVSNIKQIIDKIQNTILTISESENFLINGGILNFVDVHKKLRWEINIDALKRSEVKLDAQLLRAAIRIIKDD